MESTEFNLSVLENVTLFASPFKDFANDETILSLIKEEIDIKTDDERELQKGCKTPRFLEANMTNNTRSCNDSTNCKFKSPYTKKYSLKVKSPGSLLNNSRVRQWRRNKHKSSNELKYRKVRSLGSVKPGRSFPTNYRRYRSSISHSSETSVPSESADSSLMEKGIVKSTWENSTETESEAAELILGNGETQEVTPLSENLGELKETESTFLIPNESSKAKNSNDDFVESSQSTTSSDLRQKLLLFQNKRKPVTEIVNKLAQIDIIESEEDVQNFSLILSPDSKSAASSTAKEVCPTTPRGKKRKANDMSSPLMVSTPKHKKLNSPLKKNAKSPQIQIGAIVASPLKGLSQELENCMINCDYERLSEDIDTNLFERTSFTFETIELLNNYENADQRSNNRILSKILSSPMRKTIDEPMINLRSPNAVQPTEDPLYIEENQPTAGPSSVRKKNSEIMGKENKRKSIAKKKSIKPTQRSTRLSIMKNVDKPNEEIVPSIYKNKNSTDKGTKENMRKSIAKKKSEVRGRRSNGVSAVKDIEMIENIPENVLATSMNDNGAKTSIKENMENIDDIEGPEVNGKRRYSARLKTKQPVNMCLSDCENDEVLAAEANRLAAKIERAERQAALPEEILKKLNSLQIHLRHKVLPQHEIEPRSGNALSFEEHAEFVKFAPLNKNTYSPVEDEVIRGNWRAFCEDHNWDPKDYKPFICKQHGGKRIMNLDEKRKFLQYLANGLPNRPLCSVYTRFRLLYENKANAGARYTPEEDMQILAYMLHKPAKNSVRKCSELAKVMGRSRESIHQRYKVLSATSKSPNEKKVLTRVQWDLPLVEKFIKTLIDVTLSEELIELKDAFLPRVVWLKMEDKMNIDHAIMQTFWEKRLHMQLFSPNPIYMIEIKIKLIKLMYKKNISDRREINWRNIVKYFDGMTIFFLRTIFNHLIGPASTKVIPPTMKNMLKYLYTEKIDQLRKEPKDKCLPRILYKDRRAEILPEDLERIGSSFDDSEPG